MSDWTKELQETQNLIIDMNEAIQEYEAVTDLNNKIDTLIRVLSKTNIVMTFLIQIRYLMLLQMSNCTASNRIHINTMLNEIKIQLDVLKTCSFNYTTILNSCRDRAKISSNIDI